MPKKSRRVAAKQAELGQRKRRAPKHPAGVEAQEPTQAAYGEDPAVEVPRAAIATVAPARAPDLPRVVPQERPATAAAPRTVNPYIWPEIRRIGIITALVLVILAVLTVLLR